MRRDKVIRDFAAQEAPFHRIEDRFAEIVLRRVGQVDKNRRIEGDEFNKVLRRGRLFG